MTGEYSVNTTYIIHVKGLPAYICYVIHTVFIVSIVTSQCRYVRSQFNVSTDLKLSNTGCKIGL